MEKTVDGVIESAQELLVPFLVQYWTNVNFAQLRATHRRRHVPDFVRVSIWARLAR